MSEPIVVDSTCLIAFDLIGHLHLLSGLFQPVVVPPAVVRDASAR